MFVILLISISVLSLLGTGGLVKYLSQDLLDIPNQRSSHSKPVLRGGGLGFIIAFAIAGIVATIAKIPDPDFNLISYARIWSVLAPLAIIGFIDDRKDISAGTRYLVQLSAAGIAIYNFGTIPLPWLANLGIFGIVISIFFSSIAITAVINFYNFMDGLDGFVASVTAMQLGFIALYLNQPIFWYLVAAIVGFLWWNWSPAKIFMGDVGSTILGAAIAVILLRGQQEIIPAWSALSVTFPLIGDSIYTLVRRLLKKENIFEPHRTHIYQRLQQSGLAHSQVALIYLGVTFVSGIVLFNIEEISLGVNLLVTLAFLAVAEVYLTGIFKQLTMDN